MINVVDVWQHYGVRPVLKEISMEIRSGEIVAILGPNGMGKSTLMNVIAGTVSPQRGYVEVDGLRRRASVREELEIRKLMAFVPDQPWLPTQMTGREFVLALSRLYDVPDERRMELTDDLLTLFDLERNADWTIGSYSKGQKHKVALCGALACETPILLLDEAFTAGIDPSGINSLKKMLRHRVDDQGHTVVLTSPVAEVVEGLVDRYAIIRDGELVAFDTLGELRHQTNIQGTLGDVLQQLMFPESIDRFQKFLERYGS